MNKKNIIIEKLILLDNGHYLPSDIIVGEFSIKFIYHNYICINFDIRNNKWNYEFISYDFSYINNGMSYITKILFFIDKNLKDILNILKKV